MKALRHNHFKYATVAIFAIILVLPIVQTITRIFHVPVVNENRNRAHKPGRSTLRHPDELISQTRAWFNDNYGLRDFFIRVKTQMDYSVFGLSDRIYVGTDGWLFYRDVLDDQKPRELAMSDAEMDAAISSLGRLRDYLNKRGITLIVVTNQLKDKFYQSYVPSYAPHYGEHQRFDDFRMKLGRLPGVIYIDTTPTLEEVKKKRDIFHKTDFHWNDPAGYEIARIIVDTLAKREERTTPFWKIPVKIETRDFSGGQAMQIPLFHPLHEQALFSVPEPSVSNVIRMTGPDPFAWSEKPSVQGAALLGAMTVYGDSFFDAMERSGLSCHFKEVCLVGYNFAPLSKVLAAMPPETKYFMYQFIELSLPKLHDHIDPQIAGAI